MKEIRDLPIFKAWREEGYEIGFKQGYEIGRAEVRTEAQRRELEDFRFILVGVVKIRAPKLKKLAFHQSQLIQSLEVLEDIILNIIVAKTPGMVQCHLLNWNKPIKRDKPTKKPNA